MNQNWILKIDTIAFLNIDSLFAFILPAKSDFSLLALPFQMPSFP